ncbi:MAG: hypothetical protein Q9162_000553 [Coniocarpon cinnabarinum]
MNPESPIWMLFDKLAVGLVERLPFGLGRNSFTRYNWRGWEFKDKHRSHVELGDAFVIVTPGRNTVDGQAWQRQRKITASCFNEENNELVWEESVRQAQAMLKYWCSRSSVKSVADDVRTLSLNVLSSAGFGQSYPFAGLEQMSTGSTASSYRKSLQLILDDCILLLVLGRRFISFRWLPAKLRNLSQAVHAFEKHMVRAYETEKTAISSTNHAPNNLMTSLVRESHASTETGLTESEIYGNMFVFNFAGHDTTAHTLAFAVALLSAHPHIQDWVSEEINSTQDTVDTSHSNYNARFPRLCRCLAVMYETLRLYPEVPPAKVTGDGERRLIVGKQEILIPANTVVIPSQIATQTHPRYWGSEDPLVWRPDRWITRDPGTNTENMIAPVKGSYFPWAEGARNCPGRKFAQVEFVATIATLLRHARVEPKPRPGEDLESARRRIMHSVENDSGSVLLLQLLHPEDIEVTWTYLKQGRRLSRE